jgi:hypothetical protein
MVATLGTEHDCVKVDGGTQHAQASTSHHCRLQSTD